MRALRHPPPGMRRHGVPISMDGEMAMEPRRLSAIPEAAVFIKGEGCLQKKGQWANKWLAVRAVAALALAVLTVWVIWFFFAGVPKTMAGGRFAVKKTVSAGAEERQFSHKNVNWIADGVQVTLDSPHRTPLKVTVYYTTGLFQTFNMKQTLHGTIPAGQLTCHMASAPQFIKNIRVDLDGDGASLVSLRSVAVAQYMSAAQRGLARQRIYLALALLLLVILHIIPGPRKFYRWLFRFRYPAAGLLLIILAIGGYSGSSVAEWDQFVQPSVKPVYAEPIVGIPRIIRTDEWIVATPFMLSQKFSSQPYSYHNDVMRAEPTDSFVVTDTPVRDIVGVAHPFLAGFLLFGQRAGLSLFWYGRLLVLLLSSFELMRLITKDRRVLSAAGALLVTFAPPVQWWFSTGLPDMILYGQTAIVLIYCFLNTEKKVIKILCGAGLSVCALGYAATFYPAWQVPFFYVFGALLVWVLIENYKKHRHGWFDLAVLLAAVAFTGIILARVFLLSYDTIKTVMQTAYPGKRFETGGGVFGKLFEYFINPLFPYKDAGNPCEFSDFITFFPISLVASLYLIIKNWKAKAKKDVFLICTTAVSVALFLWVAVGWPGFLAKVSFLYVSAAGRAILAFELLQCYLLLRVIACYGPKELFAKPWAALIAAAVAVCTALVAADPLNGYAGVPYRIIAGIVLFLIGYFVLSGGVGKNIPKLRPAVMTVLIIAVAGMAGLFVNPVQKGLNAIYAKPASTMIQTAQHNRPGVWLSVNGNTPVLELQQFAIANGAPTINSVNAYPALGRWESLDPKRRYVAKYNRYAHIFVSLTNGGTTFSNLRSPDTLHIQLNINDLKKLKVDYLISDIIPSEIVPYSNTSVKITPFYAQDGVYLYTVGYPG